MSAQPIPSRSRLDSFRKALSDDPAKLARLDKNIVEADATSGVPDDLDEIASLLDPRP